VVRVKRAAGLAITGVQCASQHRAARITLKDRKAIEIGRQMGADHYALSFANRPEDVREMRALIGADARLISKIESLTVRPCRGDRRLSDAILIVAATCPPSAIARDPACQKDSCDA